ncbi:hypothetical protein JVT61DRAFT_13542 [Boletus reticuloceps]|uniref:Uncharacterized protein n=1 Tax=Boletus reticuloceps TaxID=495285 RepID=A0A8I3A2Z0_9AGAM|nr:hypothetical protein JVT61DRAFT_13542 [Boletus reticuloceps]
MDRSPGSLKMAKAFLEFASALNIPIVLTTILNHACNLAFTQRPNYSYLRTILENTTTPTDVPSLLPIPDSYSPISMPDAPSPKPIIFAPDNKMESKAIEGTPYRR